MTFTSFHRARRGGKRARNARLIAKRFAAMHARRRASRNLDKLLRDPHLARDVGLPRPIEQRPHPPERWRGLW